MVKICGITRREDAEVAVAVGASALGFIFYPPSPRYVAPERAVELGAGLDVWKVGVFVNETAADVAAVARAAQLDIVQLYGGESPQGLRVWRAFRVNELEASQHIPESVEAILLDGPRNGQRFDWSEFAWRNSSIHAAGASLHSHQGRVLFNRGVTGPHLILAGGLDDSNVAQLVRTIPAWGVDASSKLETAPGIKDHEKVRRFIAAARKAV